MMSEAHKKRFIQVSDIATMLSCSRPTVYRLIKQDETFPKPDTMLPKQQRWLYEDVEEWLTKYKSQ